MKCSNHNEDYIKILILIALMCFNNCSFQKESKTSLSKTEVLIESENINQLELGYLDLVNLDNEWLRNYFATVISKKLPFKLDSDFELDTTFKFNKVLHYKIGKHWNAFVLTGEFMPSYGSFNYYGIYDDQKVIIDYKFHSDVVEKIIVLKRYEKDENSIKILGEEYDLNTENSYINESTLINYSFENLTPSSTSTESPSWVSPTGTELSN